MTWNIFDQDEYWMTKYFSKVKILDMTDLHLQNTISMLNRNPKSFANIAYNNFVRDDIDYIEDDPSIIVIGEPEIPASIKYLVSLANKNDTDTLRDLMHETELYRALILELKKRKLG